MYNPQQQQQSQQLPPSRAPAPLLYPDQIPISTLPRSQPPQLPQFTTQQLGYPLHTYPQASQYGYQQSLPAPGGGGGAGGGMRGYEPDLLQTPLTASSLQHQQDKPLPFIPSGGGMDHGFNPQYGNGGGYTSQQPLFPPAGSGQNFPVSYPTPPPAPPPAHAKPTLSNLSPRHNQQQPYPSQTRKPESPAGEQERSNKKQKQKSASLGVGEEEEEHEHEVGEGGKGGKGMPPAKNACLSCRTKKARCDGTQPVCGQCSSKGRECVFVKSKRGGARKKREVPPAPTPLEQFLKQLDGLMAPQQVPPPDLEEMTLKEFKEGEGGQWVRVYHDQDVVGILKAYYEEIHPFQPLLPPIQHLPTLAPATPSDSPFLYAIRAILSLSPHPSDPLPSSAASRALRRRNAAALARKASERIDALVDLAGEEDDRLPDVSCVQALSLLGLYEFAQTGNTMRNRMRMNRAVELGMEMGLHRVDAGEREVAIGVRTVEGGDLEKDMRRRTWWVVFAGNQISALISGKRSPLQVDDPRIMCNYPACSIADDSWMSWITSIRLAVQAMDLILSLDYGMPNPDAKASISPPSSRADSDKSSSEGEGGDSSSSQAGSRKKAYHKRMIDLDKTVLDLLQRAETSSVIPLVPGGEEEVVRNQQLAASMMLAVCHIQLHRRQAFPEIALFSRNMCGLPKAPLAAAATDRGETPLSGVSPGMTRSTSAASPSPSSATGSAFSAVPQFAGQSQGVFSANGSGPAPGVSPVIAQMDYSTQMGMEFQSQQQDFGYTDGLLWDPSIFPSSFGTPWFAVNQGAAGLYQPIQEPPAFLPPVNGIYTAQTGYLGQPLDWSYVDAQPMAGDSKAAKIAETQGAPAPSSTSSQSQPPRPPPKTHQAWGVNIKRQAARLALPSASSSPVRPALPTSASSDADMEGEREVVVVGPDGPFPPGLSLARCAAAAHSIVRLEVLHRSAVMALWKGPPKWLPFCACGLVSGAYAFLLLCLAIQAESLPTAPSAQTEELEALWTNVKVILAGLEAYGEMWDGIAGMAGEVREALAAAKRLGEEMQSDAGSGVDGAQGGDGAQWAVVGGN